jgi:L-alanine-DL-glutamate epimerase-like enolase superfamily enzyme
MQIADFRLTRFQFPRDRAIGDSQVRSEEMQCAALELIADDGTVGLGFGLSLFYPLPALAEIERLFRLQIWPNLVGEHPTTLANRIGRPRGGNRRPLPLPFDDTLQTALWDLAAKAAGLPLYKLLGAKRNRVRAYASGLDFHMSDDEFSAFFRNAAARGFPAFKIKVGHPDFSRDLHRLKLLKAAVPAGSQMMIDANEAWGAKEALVKLEAIRDAGFPLLWVEDPILRDDFSGLKLLRDAVGWTMINSGEYLDAHGKRLLMEAEAVDILNVHGHVADTMRIGWLAANRGIPVSLGNTFLELGVHMACALPEVEWLEYSFLNYNHLVDQPVEIRDGYAYAPDRPGHGLVLSETARMNLAQPEVLPPQTAG